MSVEIRNVLQTLHPQPRNITTMQDEDAYYRAHSLTLPRWITRTATLARLLPHAVASIARRAILIHPTNG